MESTEHRATGRSEVSESRWRVLAIVFVVAAIAIGVVIAVSAEEAAPLDSPTPAQVVADPDPYAGQHVSIAGRVLAVYDLDGRGRGKGAMAFALATNGAGGLLVVPAANADRPNVSRRDSVEIEGTVQEFFARGFRGAFGSIPDGVTFGTAQRPVLLAADVAHVEGREGGQEQ